MKPVWDKYGADYTAMVERIQAVQSRSGRVPLPLVGRG